MSHYKAAGDGPVMVQGMDVESSSVAQYQTPQAPPRGCRDALFAVLFYVHLGLIAYAAAVNTPLMAQDVAEGYNIHGAGGWNRMLNDQQQQQEAQNNNNDEEETDFSFEPVHLFLTVIVATLLAFGVSTAAMGFMVACAGPLIKTALIFNVILFFTMMVLGFVNENAAVGVPFLILALLAGWYAVRVWSRIPFAASNLITAIAAVRENMGLAVYAYWSVIVLFAWSVCWALATSSTIYVQAQCDPEGNCEGSISGLLMFGFFLSFYWTSQIITNVVHVTTAGTVGTWWFNPELAASCCSSAVRDSYGRSLTTSFGSICLGSLLVAIVQSLKEIAYAARDGEDSVLICCAACILNCIESLLEYFNKWAFVYCGIHGYSFFDAGKNAMQLFRSRGWTAIVADTMVDTVLFMVSIGVALLIGITCVPLTAAALDVEDKNAMWTAFFLGLLVGYGVCATLFSVISSAVNTVIVCYAESPNDFNSNHPELSENMRESWRQAWPTDFSY